MVKTGMKQSRILLTGFEATKRDVSASKVMLEKIDAYEKFLFSNDYDLIKEEIDAIIENHYDYIIMFGWKPAIKRVTIEVEATYKKASLFTNYPLNEILADFKAKGISYNFSQNAGTSYCNYAYYHLLKKIYDNNLTTKVLFIHIPNLEKFNDIKKVINTFNK